MIVKKARYSRSSRLSSRNSPRRNDNNYRNGGYQRNGSFGGDNPSKMKMRGNPSQMLEKYMGLARNALSSGDRIQAEYYFQHADHYSRIIVESGNEVNLVKDSNLGNITNSSLSTHSNNKNYVKDDIVQNSKNVDENQNEESETNLESVAFLSGATDKK